MGGLPPVFIEFLGHSKGVKTAMADVKAELASADAAGAGSFAKTGMMGKAALAGLGLAAAGVAMKTVHMAADFQQQMTRVRTGAGEAAANMKLVGQGVLAMAGEVGQSTSQLTSGLYMVESAGYHGADALSVLKASAMGAKVGAADLKTATDAVTTAMNDYKSGAGSATQVTNALIATEAEGKTNLEALAGSMSSILPVASSAHVGLNEVLGAMATMTAQGTPAAVAATYLRQTIGQLSNPLGKAGREMESLGLSAVQVSQNLGKKGLASTLTMLTDAIEHHMGPAGTVLISHLQKAAHNTTAFQKELANLSPSQQTYIGALATMVGGTKSMMAALQLTGPHMKEFKDKTEAINERVKTGGKTIEGWADVQKNFNQQTARAKASLEAMGIQIGQYLMPYVQKLVGWLAQGATWLTKHTLAAKIAAGVIGGILVFAVVALTAALVDMAVAAAMNPMTWIVLAVIALIVEIVLLVVYWRRIWDLIKRITGIVVDWIVDKWNWLTDQAASIWSSISGAVVDAWNSLVGYVSTAWHAVVDPIVTGWHWFERTTSAVWDGITGFFKKWWPLLLVIFMPAIAAVMGVWNHFHGIILSTVHAVWNAVLGVLKTVWGGIKAAAKFVWGLIRVSIVDPIMATWRTIVSVWETVHRWLSTMWAGIRRVASDQWARIKASMIDPIVGAWHKITSTIGDIKKSISAGLDSAWNKVKGIGSKFLSVGHDIVMGIVHGIENAAGSLFDSLKGLADSALKNAKHSLDINSPSKKFADQVGSAIPEGVAKGVTDNAHLAHAAVTAMSDQLAGNRMTFGGARPGPGPALAGNRGGGSHITTIHVHVAGHVMTERQLVDVVEQSFLERGGRNSQTYPPYNR